MTIATRNDTMLKGLTPYTLPGGLEELIIAISSLDTKRHCSCHLPLPWLTVTLFLGKQTVRLWRIRATLRVGVP